MNTGSKILIIEDERSGISDFSKALCSSLPNSEEERKKREEEWKGIPLSMPKTGGVSKEDPERSEFCFNQFNNFWAGVALCPKSFADAFRLVEDVENGQDYAWIFIDRNLKEYHDIKSGATIQINEKVFNPDFFKSVAFAGDYLFNMLVTAGVPIAKICFLTANDDASIDELKKSHWLNKQFPDVISKNDTGYDKVREKLRDPLCAQIRFLYKDIFENAKVKDIWESDIEKFIAILAKQYKHENRSKDDGNTLRKMIESVVSYIALEFFNNKWPKGTATRVRSFLNGQSDYRARLPNEDAWNLYQNWLKLSVELGHFPISPADQKYIENTYFPNLAKATGIKKGTKDAEAIIKYSTAKILHFLYDHFYKDNSSTNIPKYIFSYIDNIYTVTSEVSSHGPNNETTNGLSLDGWNALLSGMLQIMQWVADTNPN